MLWMLPEAILTSTHSRCFYGEIKKIFFSFNHQEISTRSITKYLHVFSPSIDPEIMFDEPDHHLKIITRTSAKAAKILPCETYNIITVEEYIWNVPILAPS